MHTELLSDALVDLIERGVVTGSRKQLARGRSVTTFALGTQRLYDFLHENAAVEFLPVDHVNDPRVIAEEDCFVSINATTEVDLIGQCASETVGGRYWSSSGGQADFARGAMYSPHGKAFVVLPSTAADGAVSRIRATLTPGSVVTTLKNTVDHIVTEHGVAEMRGRSISERARALDRHRRPTVPRRPHPGGSRAQLPVRGGDPCRPSGRPSRGRGRLPRCVHQTAQPTPSRRVQPSRRQPRQLRHRSRSRGPSRTRRRPNTKPRAIDTTCGTRLALPCFDLHG